MSMPRANSLVPFPVSLNLQGRRCIVIGDDREADEKAAALAESGARVERIKDLGAFDDAQLADAFFVISTPQDEQFSARLRALADGQRFLLCCIDQPAHGFVSMAAIVKAGPVRVAISTAGMAPRVGKILKAGLQRALDTTFERFISCQAALKLRNRRRFPTSSAKRRQAMIDAAKGFDVGVTGHYPQWFEDAEASRRPRILD